MSARTPMRMTCLAAALPASAASARSQAPPEPVPLPAVLRDYAPVTEERLLNPEDGNWLSIRGTHDS